MSENLDANQTEFAGKTPILEMADSLPSPEVVVVDEKAAAKAKRTKLALVAVVFSVLVFMLLLLLIKQALPKMAAPSPEETPDVVNQTKTLDPLLEEIYLISDDLRAADPSVEETIFPPVDMGLRLDPAKRR